MSNIPNLASLARLRLGSGGGSTVRRKAFGFDGVNDYISSNATIGRTGYDMNVSGNVTTGSDGDGSYIQFNGNRDTTAVSGTFAAVNTTSAMTWTQTQDFTMKVRIKINSLPPNNNVGIFGSGGGGTNGFTASIWANGSLSSVQFTLRTGASPVTYSGPSLTIGVLYDLYLVWVASDQKFYCYRGISGAASSLLNTGGTSYASTFTFSGLRLGDDAHGGGNTSSNSKYVYHACIRNKALTQAEIDADIALGNTTKQDSSIVAYYVPENLQFNTDYITTKDFSNAARTKTGTTVTSGIADIRGGTSAYTLTISAGAGNGATITNNTVTGSSLASKTFIMKVFARTASGTATMRLRISHNGVSTYYSADQTVTTTPQEFTFTQALTSSTSGTGMTYGIEVGSAAGAATINVFYPTDRLTNQTLRDESPNIGGFLGWRNNKVLSCRVKPGKDGVDNGDSQCLFSSPRLYTQIRSSTNNVVLRYENTLAARSKFYTLGAGFRDKVHVAGVYYWDTPNLKRELKLYINGVSAGTLSGTPEKQPPNAIVNTAMRNARKGTTYYQGNIRDQRIYTFTGSFTDADALAIYNGGEPTSVGVTKYLHYRPPVGEVGTTTEDQSPNDRDGTLNGGVTRDYI